MILPMLLGEFPIEGGIPVADDDTGKRRVGCEMDIPSAAV